MGYGIRAFNSTGGLTLSSDGMVYHYVGRAALVSITQPTGDIYISEAYNGFSTYTIEHAGDIVVALPLGTNGCTALIDARRSGNTWTIEVMKSTGQINALGFDVQEVTSPIVFGAPVSVSGWGFAMYSKTGVLTADLTKRPLTFDRLIDFGLNVGQVAVSPAVASPAVIGNSIQVEQTNLPYEPSTFTYQNRKYNSGWIMNPANTFIQRVTWLSEFIRSTEQAAAMQFQRPSTCLVISASGL